METIHNGKKFLIRVFDFNYHSMIGRLNAEGKENPHVVFYEGTEDETLVYYQETEQKNGTSIIIETSPSQRNIFKKAVTHQLQYFDNIEFNIIEEDGTVNNIPTSTELLYDGKYFSIPSKSDYTKPHLILNRVNYGLINYPSMEVEERKGCLAFKINPSSVEVDRSRESLIWNEKTRNAILDFHEKVEEEAIEVFHKSLIKSNFAEWIENIMAYYVGRNNTDSNISVSSILKSFLEGYDVDTSKLTWGPDKIPHFNLTDLNSQLVRSSEHPGSLSTGRSTATFKEMGIFLQYNNDVSRTSIIEGIPVVIRIEEDRIKDFRSASISAAEKFSILKYLRDKIDPTVQEYVIITIRKSNKHGMLFYESLPSAKTRNPNQYFDFEEASKAYVINIESGESEIKSKREVEKAQAALRRAEQAKTKRQNKVMTVKEYSNIWTGTESYLTPEDVLRRAEGNPIYYGRHFTKGYSVEEDDEPFLRFLGRNKNDDSQIYLCSTVKSHLDWFPHDQGVYVKNYFTNIKDKKFQFQDISQMLILIAYFEEIMDLYALLYGSKLGEWSSELNKLYIIFQETFGKSFDYASDKFNADTYKANPDYLLKKFLEDACYSFHPSQRIDMINFIHNIAKFGRFAYENSSASEDFLANAYITIMGMPEDTPLDSVPIGVEGFNYSPIKDIRDILSKLDPVIDLIPSLKIVNIRGIEPILDIAFRQRNFKYSSINL